MSAYVLAHVNITNAEDFGKYTAQFAPTLVPYGGKVLIVEDNPDVLEGQWPPGRTVMIEFASVEQATAWYKSDRYQSISATRRASSDATMAIVAGI